VRGDRELADLKRLYNELADTVRRSASALHHKEILLDTILQRTPVAVSCSTRRGASSTRTPRARELLAGGAR
jgi:hypothetical protein